jgi:hypothetical protein
MGTPEQNKDAAGALAYAFENGVLSLPALAPQFERPPEIAPDVAALLSRYPAERRRVDRITDQLSDVARDTRAQEYQDVSFFHTRAPTDPVFDVNNAYEIARFVSKGQSVGVVNLLWTYAEVMDDPQTQTLKEPRWWDPFTVQRNLGLVNSLYWFVRLYQSTSIQPYIPAPYVGPYREAPGYGIAELADWQDYRFMWGSNNTQNFLLVPSDHALRLYVRFLPGNPIPLNPRLTRLGGRLLGYTQPSRVKSAGYNVTHGFY